MKIRPIKPRTQKRLIWLTVVMCFSYFNALCADTAHEVYPVDGTPSCIMWTVVQIQVFLFIAIIAQWLAEPFIERLSCDRRWKRITSLPVLGCIISLLCCLAGAVWAFFRL